MHLTHAKAFEELDGHVALYTLPVANSPLIYQENPNSSIHFSKMSVPSSAGRFRSSMIIMRSQNMIGQTSICDESMGSMKCPMRAGKLLRIRLLSRYSEIGSTSNSALGERFAKVSWLPRYEKCWKKEKRDFQQRPLHMVSGKLLSCLLGGD